jgi:ribosomal protein L40E
MKSCAKPLSHQNIFLFQKVVKYVFEASGCGKCGARSLSSARFSREKYDCPPDELRLDRHHRHILAVKALIQRHRRYV